MAIIPKRLSLDAVAPILCAGITVYKGLKESGARPRDMVAIVGAGGGRGLSHSSMRGRWDFGFWQSMRAGRRRRYVSNWVSR